MKKLILLLVVLALLIPATAVIASDVDTAEYITNISITNNSTDDKSAVATTLTLSTADMIESNMLNATATDCAIQRTGAVDVAFMPSANSTYPWCIWVPTSDAVSTANYYLYTGGVTGGKIRYFPGPEGMTTTDNATMELGDNFAVMWSAFFNTDNGTDKYIVNKEMSFRVFVSPTESGSIISEIVSVNATSEYLYPAGVGSETSIPSETPPAGTHWELVSDTDDGTYLIENSTDWTRDLYVCENTSTTSIYRGNINEVTFYFRIIATFESSIYAKPSMKIGDTIYDGTEVSTSLVEWATYSENFTLNPVTSENWTWDDIAGMEIGVSLKGNIEGRCSEVYIVIDYDEISVIATVTATGVSKGEHEIIVKVLE